MGAGPGGPPHPGMKRYVITSIAVLLVGVLLWQLRGGQSTAGDELAEASVERFLAQHWNHPLPPQGAARGDASVLEASLGAEACGNCHQEQLSAWRGSLHSQAMGPGIQWQLTLMDQEQANRCLQCHAPLAEQKALVALERGWSAAPKQVRPAYVPQDLHQQGVACAVCHVRGHERFGPPRREGKAAEPPAHGGFTAHRAFEDSRFCAGCHQFPEDGPRLAGKLQEDTFAQWQASDFADRQSCQQCHMPDRQHLFRGIHDPETVRSAVMLELAAVDEGGRSLARAVVRNVGAGHHFPTYMVPKVYLRLFLNGPEGERRLLGEEVIGWQVDVGITREEFDTRIAAGGQFEFEVPFDAPASAGWSLEAVMDVAPREHYERVFATSLQQADRMGPETLKPLQQALVEARATRFEALRIRRGLDDIVNQGVPAK